MLKRRPLTHGVPLSSTTDNGQPTTDKVQTTDNGQPTTPRRGFTLVELLMVIVILAVLIALLLPAVNSARRNVLITQVRSEISGLEQAVAAFRATYGVDPPSSITIFKNEAAWNATPQGRESKALIRRIWPNFDFSTAGGLTLITPDPFAGNDFVTIYGDECLVFFLGGMADVSSGALTGFSTDPAHPFALASPGSSATRKGPFFEFDMRRIVHSPHKPDSIPTFVYLDPMAAKSGQTNGYIYLSSRDGRGYRVNPNTGVCLDYPPNSMTYVYKIPDSSAPNDPTKGTPYKAKSFQIIAPGGDGLYGVGGPYDPDNSNFTGDRAPERDNITNFHEGTLGG